MPETQTIDIVYLQTGLFGDASVVLEAVASDNELATEFIDLRRHEQMGEADWDAVIDLVLRAGKVVTL